MIVDQPVSNPVMALFHATQIAKLRSLNPQANIDAALIGELPDNFKSAFFAADSFKVAMYIGGNQNRVVVYLDGVTGLQQSSALMSGYTGLFFLPHDPPLNSWLQENLAAYLARITATFIFPPEYLDLVGYSAGGAVATAMMYDLIRRQSTLKMKLITFGSPRPGGSIVRNTLARAASARWMTPNDPIPLVPPRIQDANALVATVTPVTAITWSSTVHVHGGLQVNNDGSIDEAVLPSQAAINATSSLPNWLFSEENDPQNDHAIFRYIANLTATAQINTRPGRVQHDGGPGEQPEDNKRRDVNQARDRVVTAIANQQHAQLAQPVNIPQLVLFTPVKLGRVWAVGFGDQIIAQGIHEKTCRHICRAGNDFLRSLPKQSIVDIDALQGQLSAFLVLAQDPTSGISPLIQTVLNQQ